MEMEKTKHRNNVKLLTLVFLVIAILSPSIEMNGAEKEAGKKAIYNPQLHIKAAISQATTIAEKENKHILLMFGGNWCPWCHKLHNLMQMDNVLQQYIQKNYLVIMIDVGEKANEPLNRDLVDLYRVKDFGYPSLAILDKKGRLLTSQSTGVLEKDKAHDPDRVLSFLKANAPH